MRFVSVCLLTFALSITASCGSSGDAESNEQNSITSDDTTSSDSADTGATSGDTESDTGAATDPDMAAYAEQICNRINTCMSELTCTQPVELDIPGCVAQFVEQGVTAEDVTSWENNACTNINEVQCNDPTVSANCECPEVPQGDCPDGYLCNIALQGGQYACGESSGSIPADAPECNAQTPCPDQDNNQVCVTTTADAENGQCIYLCER